MTERVIFFSGGTVGAEFQLRLNCSLLLFVRDTPAEL